jgi:hypothetical protein
VYEAGIMSDFVLKGNTSIMEECVNQQVKKEERQKVLNHMEFHSQYCQHNLKNWDVIEQQTAEGAEIATNKWIQTAKHSGLESEIFDGFAVFVPIVFLLKALQARRKI